VAFLPALLRHEDAHGHNCLLQFLIPGKNEIFPGGHPAHVLHFEAHRLSGNQKKHQNSTGIFFL